MAAVETIGADLTSLPVRAVSIEAASRMYGLGKSTLREAIRNGQLRSYRVGRRVLLKLADLEAWIEKGGKI